MTLRHLLADVAGGLLILAAGALLGLDARDAQVSAVAAAVALAIATTGGLLIDRARTVALLTTLRELLASALRLLLTGSTEMPPAPPPGEGGGRG